MPMSVEVEGRDQEADEVEGDQDNHYQVKVEEDRSLEERLGSVVLRSNEAGVFAHIRKRNMDVLDEDDGPECVHQSNEYRKQCWNSLGI